jgi:hypothetical protein
MSAHEPCTCRPRLKFKKPSYRYRRDIARRIIRAIATQCPDSFSQRQAARAYKQAFSNEAPNTYWGFGPDEWSTFTWLRQHGFVEAIPGTPKIGSHRRYQLSAQSIRWLDWVRFNWQAEAL